MAEKEPGRTTSDDMRMATKEPSMLTSNDLKRQRDDKGRHGMTRGGGGLTSPGNRIQEKRSIRDRGFGILENRMQVLGWVYGQVKGLFLNTDLIFMPDLTRRAENKGPSPFKMDQAWASLLGGS